MQRLEVSGAVRPLCGSLGVKGLMQRCCVFVRKFVASTIHDGQMLTIVNPLVLELDICSLAHHLCKM